MAVVGAHLTGQPLNWQLTQRKGRLVKTCRTHPDYRCAGQVQVGVVEDVVELGAELDLQALDGRAEVLVEREVGLVEGRGAAGIAAGVAEGAEHVAGAHP
jgi:hypothetical protein